MALARDTRSGREIHEDVRGRCLDSESGKLLVLAVEAQFLKSKR
jgi:hypothetical protein